MIPVSPKPEYPGFDSQVRKRGKGFLSQCPSPDSKQFRRHSYWKYALDQLSAAYDHLCAYTSKELVDSGSIDHFKPKSKYPHLAYEWKNFRLARQTINSRKKDSEDVLDPFAIRLGWFVLDMPSCLIKPGHGISRNVEVAVNTTINVLQLNRDDRLVQERCNLLVDLADGNVTLKFLDRHFPFLSSEVRRQGVSTSLKLIFSRP